MAVLAVGAEDGVLRLQSSDSPDRNSLLADLEVAEPSNLSKCVHFGTLLFKAPD